MNVIGLFKISRLAVWGLLAFVAGLGAAGYGTLHEVPLESALQTVDGHVEKATRVTTRRRRGSDQVNYELVVKDVKGSELKLSLPAAEISEAQVRDVLNARHMQAKFDAENDVYVLVSDGRTVLDYATTRKRRINSDETMVGLGILGVGGGVLLFLVGWLWNRRRLA